jgi:hypothetical protein
MNSIKLAVGSVAGFLACVGSAFADTATPLPIEDGGLFFVAAAGLAVAIRIARAKQKR